MRKLSPALFGLALICFFLPWVTVSCQGHKIISLNGIQLVTGTTIEEPKVFKELEGLYSHIEKPGRSSDNKIKGSILAMFALLASIGGIGLSFLRGKKGFLGPAIAGITGVISLIALSERLNNKILQEGGGLLQLDYRAGFYLTLILFLSATGVNIYSIVPGKTLPLHLQEEEQPFVKFCSQCGAQVSPDDAFCHQCGHFLK